MKKTIIIISIFIILLIILFIINLFNNNENSLEKSFDKLLQYKTNSINDNENFNNILANTEINKYIIKIEKTLNEDKECLIIYYNTNNIKDKSEIQNFNTKKYSIIEKDSVLMFTLINDLEKIIYIDNNIIENNSDLKYEEAIKTASIEYNREQINSYYNQDVRNYVDIPNNFLKYNINTNIEYITLYVYTNEVIKTKDNKYEYKINKIIIDDENEIKTIKDFIETQNFEIPHSYIESTIDMAIDLNNGYIIKMFSGDNRFASIHNGTWDKNSEKGILKLLPIGLKDYIINTNNFI